MMQKKNIRLAGLGGLGLFLLMGVFGLGVSYANSSFPFGNIGMSSLPSSLNYTSVNQEYQVLKDNYDGKLTQTQLLDGIKQGLASSVNDPYTEYFTASQAKQFNDQLNNSFSGIGAELSKNSQKQIEIMSPLKNSPAAKAGVQAKDVIAAINNKTTSGMTINDAVDAIRGKAGTRVVLTIIRGSKEFNVSVNRQNITVPSVSFKVVKGNIGYISIISFANDTPQLINQAAQSLSQDHLKGIILDLRDNPGGLVTSAVATTSEWLKSGQIVMQEKRGSDIVQTYSATGGDILHGLATVVLVNGGSASASEITAGALHDNHDAVVMGTKTFGKGVVQQLINLADGGELKVTVAAWYRPDGEDINHKGITPDITIKPNSNGSDNQLTSAENYIATH